jgi:uncharacterized protein YdeI (YjbR/CyaY-like superfamily)
VADEAPILELRTKAAWAKWLAKHDADEAGAWLKFAKKNSGVTTVTYAEALEVALCHGWIDSQVKSLDEQCYLQRFTPRRKRSKWSKINREAATKLIETGAMKPAGLRQIELAQADGRWDAAYAGQATATIPADLEQALAENKPARDFFAKLSSQNRYAILFRLDDAKRPETRARRLAKFVEMLARGETLH